ncbi:hypothetical protein FJY63_09885 [Candidatus Sumerlaeota bacterium]|nr:hypothetical protein [Candidatus Sumerlaeota bacterium]
MKRQIRCENILVVLVEPQNPGNIGAAARALYNMGLDNLAIVGWKEDVESRRTAHEWATDGESVLKKAKRSTSLAEAIAGCGLAIATSARCGADRPPVIERHDLIALLKRWTPNNRVALVFGPERTGLRNEHLQLCSHMLTLPTAPGCTSLNLAQSVLLVSYEILLATADQTTATAKSARAAGSDLSDASDSGFTRVATRSERIRLYQHASEALQAVGFLKLGHPTHPLDQICYVLDRAAATSHEVRILHGMCRKILSAARSKGRSRRQ